MEFKTYHCINCGAKQFDSDEQFFEHVRLCNGVLRKELKRWVYMAIDHTFSECSYLQSMRDIELEEKRHVIIARMRKHFDGFLDHENNISNPTSEVSDE